MMEGVYDQIHALPRHWHRSKLGDVMEVIRGASPRPKGDPKYFGGRIPWIMISDVTREKGKYLSQTRDHVTEEGAKKSRYLKSGTLILSNSGTVCVPKILAVDGCIHDGFVAFPAIPGQFDVLYLYYFFDHIRPRVIDAHRQGITQVNLNTNIVKNIQLPVPPRHEQEEIVAEIEKQFSRLDEAVASLKRTKANLKRYKAAVLKAAVEGKLTEEWRKKHPDVEPASKLLERIVADRRAKWFGRGKYNEPEAADVADLPSLPSNWKWASLDQLFLNITDGDHQPPPQTDSGVPFIVIGNVRSGKLEFEDTRFVPRQYADEVDVFRKPARGDILYTLVGSFGVALRVDTYQEFCIQRHIGILRPHELSPAPYVVHVLNSSFVFSQATNVATGTAQKTVPLAGLRRFAIPLAPFAEQQQIIAEIERRLSVIDELEATVQANLTRADLLRQSVLRKAFSGELLRNGPRV